MLDYISIFKRFNEDKIRYMVIGGIAVNLYGIPRMTYDIDLLLDLEDENLENFLRLLNEWGFKPKVPVDIMDFAKEERRKDWIENKNMKAFNLVNPDWAISEIDIIINTPVTYQDAKDRMKYILLQDISIPTISIEDLIKMKEGSKREQDKADIENLKKILDER